MTWDHDEVVTVLSNLLFNQLDRRHFACAWKAAWETGNIFRPDICVVQLKWVTISVAGQGAGDLFEAAATGRGGVVPLNGRL